tara:strand:- start:475 stop:1245 length:771 start_codon:yes stop_codon:yes gene_type:complete
MKINKNTLIYILLVGIILLLAKCNSDANSNLDAQTIISQNNIEVLNDSIKTIKFNNGTLISERGVLITSKEDLKELNKDLYEDIKDLEKTIPNMKPTVVVKYITKIEHDTTYIKSNIVALNDSTYRLKFNKDTTYNENNSRHLEGSITINILKDSSKFDSLDVSKVTISKDIMNMDATLALGMKDGKLKVWLKTEYPGFQADEIDAVTLDPNIHPELRKLNNKKFSIGPYVGFGIGQNLSISPSIGIGVQYSLFKF